MREIGFVFMLCLLLLVNYLQITIGAHTSTALSQKRAFSPIAEVTINGGGDL
jgi:hypothetical protein